MHSKLDDFNWNFEMGTLHEWTQVTIGFRLGWTTQLLLQFQMNYLGSLRVIFKYMAWSSKFAHVVCYRLQTTDFCHYLHSASNSCLYAYLTQNKVNRASGNSNGLSMQMRIHWNLIRKLPAVTRGLVCHDSMPMPTNYKGWMIQFKLQAIAHETCSVSFPSWVWRRSWISIK